MNNFFCEMEEHSWDSARNLIRDVCPTFADIVDDISPNREHRLYRVKYPYGALVLDKGIFQLPNPSGRLVPLHHSSIPNIIKEDLEYSGTIPLGLVTTNGFESFVKSESKILPSSYMGKGSFLSLWRVFEEGASYYRGPYWNYSAGARSICMLPKITDSASYKNLKKKYKLNLPIPQHLSEHWNIFIQIANHTDFPNPWRSEIIFFSKHWFDHKTDKRWKPFYHYLLNEVWQNSFFIRNFHIFDTTFSLAIENRKLKPNPYLADTVKHLIALACGSSLSFAPAVDNSAAPISGLQKVFLEDYGLKKYAPVIMHSYHFTQKNNRPAYYSFQFPNTTIFSPKSRKLASTMTEMHELKHIMETLMSEILKGYLGVEQTPLYDIAQNIRFGYYHSEKDKSGEILQASEITKFDSNFVKTLCNENSYTFPEFAPFFKGCVTISKSK